MMKEFLEDLFDQMEDDMIKEAVLEALITNFRNELSMEDIDNVAQFIWVNYQIIKSEETFPDNSLRYKQQIIYWCTAPLLMLLNTEDSREYCLKAVAAYTEYIQRLVEVPKTEKDSRP